MIKKFEQFTGPLNEGLLNAKIGLHDKRTYISFESKYWNSAHEYFENETGKDLNQSQFSWVFKRNNLQDDINAAHFAIALMKNSKVMSQYQSVAEYMRELLADKDLNYTAGSGKNNYLSVSKDALGNSRALYVIWTDYFYTPLKNAIVSKNFSSISISGMKDFKERMEIYVANYDSDWKNFFNIIKMGIKSPDAAVSTSAASTSTAPTTTKKTSTPTQKTKPAGTSGKPLSFR